MSRVNLDKEEDIPLGEFSCVTCFHHDIIPRLPFCVISAFSALYSYSNMYISEGFILYNWLGCGCVRCFPGAVPLLHGDCWDAAVLYGVSARPVQP